MARFVTPGQTRPLGGLSGHPSSLGILPLALFPPHSFILIIAPLTSSVFRFAPAVPISGFPNSLPQLL
jgi:hypothetical protein